MRSKIECFTKLGHIETHGKGAIYEGTKLHKMYNHFYRDFDAVRVRSMLGGYKRIFQKKIEPNIVVRGEFDNLRVIRYNNKKYTILLEAKTTSKKYMWAREVQAATKQLQLYQWLLKEELDKIGYPLWRRGYIEVFSQVDGKLIRRIPVEYDYDIENWIIEVVKQFQGLEKMDVPAYAYCKLCPRQIREHCSWFYIRSKKEW
jgi:hypothetical protein